MAIKKPEIITRLEKNNTQDAKIKIRARAKNAGGYTVYLDFFKDGNREFEFLDKSLHLTGTPATLTADKEKLALIVGIKNQRQNEYLKNKTGFSLLAEKDIDFLQYYKKLADKKNNRWQSPLKQFCNFINADKISFKKIDYKFCSRFAEYLQSNTGSLNSAFTYFSIFKAALNKAIKEDIILKNPASNVIMNKADTKREFLNIDEIRILSATPKPNIDSCNAFLFSCFTGLRISDIKALTFDHIIDGYLEFKQQKTQNNERMMLNKTARDILKLQADFKRTDKVFNLVISVNIGRHLKPIVPQIITCNILKTFKLSILHNFFILMLAF